MLAFIERHFAKLLVLELAVTLILLAANLYQDWRYRNAFAAVVPAINLPTGSGAINLTINPSVPAPVETLARRP